MRTLESILGTEEAKDLIWGHDTESPALTNDPRSAAESALEVAAAADPENGCVDTPKAVTVWSYAPLTPTPCAFEFLPGLLEYLDDEYGNPDGDPTEPTPAMLAVASATEAVMRAEYRVWEHERVEEFSVEPSAWFDESGNSTGGPTTGESA